ncbi:hypothetical protein LKL35_36010 [Streptomyces sp. ET3-23]|uniref:hypothetical protein n=1 Tax=Streptomyces sp. ET3-23 TaxID=2885643 RepID=UPI001D0FCFF4|nr:hypothetical protein [Streptomyces sp. ET3-23]MCC2280743.1 hypothetical protein [Streptomyces sp. ET3-23]
MTVTVVEPEQRKDGKRRWAQRFFPQTAGLDQCDACRNAASSPDPVRAVLSAVPDKLLRACGGVVPPGAMRILREELQYRSVRQLTARIERRWWGSWASRLLFREPDEKQEGYRPDDVVQWLLLPTDCPAQCEDGFSPDDPDRPCPHCRSNRPATFAAGDDNTEPAPAPAASRTTSEAIAYRPPMNECTGRGSTCGLPVAASYTQCPDCLDWPRCACGCRYDPELGQACSGCRSFSA